MNMRTARRARTNCARPYPKLQMWAKWNGFMLRPLRERPEYQVVCKPSDFKAESSLSTSTIYLPNHAANVTSDDGFGIVDSTIDGTTSCESNSFCPINSANAAEYGKSRTDDINIKIVTVTENADYQVYFTCYDALSTIVALISVVADVISDCYLVWLHYSEGRLVAAFLTLALVITASVLSAIASLSMLAQDRALQEPSRSFIEASSIWSRTSLPVETTHLNESDLYVYWHSPSSGMAKCAQGLEGHSAVNAVGQSKSNDRQRGLLPEASHQVLHSITPSNAVDEPMRAVDSRVAIKDGASEVCCCSVSTQQANAGSRCVDEACLNSNLMSCSQIAVVGNTQNLICTLHQGHASFSNKLNSSSCCAERSSNTFSPQQLTSSFEQSNKRFRSWPKESLHRRSQQLSNHFSRCLQSWILLVLFHLLPLTLVPRYLISLICGLRSQQLERSVAERRYFHYQMLWENYDAAYLRLFKAFFESAPQFLLQSVLVLQREKLLPTYVSSRKQSYFMQSESSFPMREELFDFTAASSSVAKPDEQSDFWKVSTLRESSSLWLLSWHWLKLILPMTLSLFSVAYAVVCYKRSLRVVSVPPLPFTHNAYRCSSKSGIAKGLFSDHHSDQRPCACHEAPHAERNSFSTTSHEDLSKNTISCNCQNYVVNYLKNHHNQATKAQCQCIDETSGTVEIVRDFNNKLRKSCHDKVCFDLPEGNSSNDINCGNSNNDKHSNIGNGGISKSARNANSKNWVWDFFSDVNLLTALGLIIAGRMCALAFCVALVPVAVTTGLIVLHLAINGVWLSACWRFRHVDSTVVANDANRNDDSLTEAVTLRIMLAALFLFTYVDLAPGPTCKRQFIHHMVTVAHCVLLLGFAGLYCKPLENYGASNLRDNAKSMSATSVNLATLWFSFAPYMATGLYLTGVAFLLLYYQRCHPTRCD